MKKIIVFLFVISGTTAALPASSQVARVDHATIIIEGNPLKVELFPGVYEFFGCTKAGTIDSNSVTACLHAITLDEGVAGGILGKNFNFQASISGPVLDDVSISRIISHAVYYLAEEQKRTEDIYKKAMSKVRDRYIPKGERVMTRRELPRLKKELEDINKGSKSQLEELEKRLKIRARQGTIYIYQAEIQDRTL